MRYKLLGAIFLNAPIFILEFKATGICLSVTNCAYS